MLHGLLAVVMLALAPAGARSAEPGADAHAAWRTWFWSQPGGPLDDHAAPRPGPQAGEPWREFQTPANLSRLWGGAFSDATLGSDGLERVAYRYGGEVLLAQRTGPRPSDGWRHERVADTALEWGALALARDSRNRVHCAYETAADGPKQWVHAIREPYGLWKEMRQPEARRNGPPFFRATDDGQTVLDFGNAPLVTPVPPAPPLPRRSPSPWWLLCLAPLPRWWLVRRRARARAAFRREAANVGRGTLIEVVVRQAGAARFGLPSAGLLLLHGRSPVLWTAGPVSPAEAWMGAGWTIQEGKSGWVEARCGAVRLELAPEPGLLGIPSREAARRLLDVLRASRGGPNDNLSQKPKNN